MAAKLKLPVTQRSASYWPFSVKRLTAGST